MAAAGTAGALLGAGSQSGTGNGGNQVMKEQGSPSIGVATMNPDRSISLRLRAESDDGAVGEGFFTYSPTDKEYESVLRHIGGLEPGESKPVPPWPD